MSKPFIQVAVGVMINEHGQVLLAQRPENKPWAGWWEFPGGKIETGESPTQALVRELKEELDVQITDPKPWVRFIFDYPKTTVDLDFYKIHHWQGEPKGLEQQAFAWTDPAHAASLGDLLPASIAPLDWLQIPAVYALSDFRSSAHAPKYWAQFETALSQGIRLFQFREPAWDGDVASLKKLFETMLERCHQAGAQLLVNSVHPKAWAELADGVHLRSQDAVLLEARPLSQTKRVAVSCHHLADLLYAAVLEADFVVLGHVLETPSHPAQRGMGWQQFAQFASQAGRPVFAIGGQSPESLGIAQEYGAHGIAGVRFQTRVAESDLE